MKEVQFPGENILKLVISLVIPQLAGYWGSRFIRGSISTWYVSLKKPAFTPPDWVFEPVWIMLYFLMGIALYLVWRQGINRIDVQRALYIFFFQLAVNVFWVFMFFGRQSPAQALAVLAVLLLLIALTFFSFYTVNSDAAFCLVPYMVWVAFALILNLYIVIMNGSQARLLGSA
jgi:tryptophan-rich sensory protein